MEPSEDLECRSVSGVPKKVGRTGHFFKGFTFWIATLNPKP